jgi:nicotinamidase-related amidase
MNRTEPNKNDHSNPSKTALLLIDVISDFEFEDGEKLFENALPMAMRLKELKARAERSGIPVIFVTANGRRISRNRSDIISRILSAAGK